MFKHKKKIIFILIVALGIGGFYYQKSKKPKVEYTTVLVERGDVEETVSVTGEVTPPEQVNLSFEAASGRITGIFVSLGESVTEGQKIATIDQGTFDEQLKQAEEDIRTQKETLDNMKKRNDVYNRDQRDAQRALIRKFEAAYQAIIEQMGKTTLKSPIDGYVIKKNYEEGELAVSTQPVVVIAEVGELILEANVPESDIASIKIGQKAEATFDAFTLDEKFSVEVTEIEPAATVIQEVVYYKVKFKMERVDPRIRIGMSADIDVFTDKKENVLFIPERAVKTESSQKYVEVLKEDNTTERKDVVTGMKGDDGVVEIVSGVKEGEKVVTLKK